MGKRPLTKAEAIQAFIDRLNNQPEQINNDKLPAGAPMYFYCKYCGYLSDTLPENYFLSRPTHVCQKCDYLKDMGWMEEAIEASSKVVGK